MRYFTPNPEPHRVPTGQYQVVHIGEDVTVRYFTPISRQVVMPETRPESTQQKPGVEPLDSPAS
jgi:hypothetical protein